MKIKFLFVTALISCAVGGYFYLLFILFKYIIYPITISIIVQLMDKKGKTYLLKKETVVKINTYYIGKITTEEKEEYLENVFFNSPKLMKETYIKFSVLKLIVYIMLIILGLILINSKYDLIFLLPFFFYSFYQFIKFMLIYKIIRNEEYEHMKIDINNVRYYSAFIEKEKKKELKQENLYNLIFN